MNQLTVISIPGAANLSEVSVTFKRVSATSGQLTLSLNFNDACMA